MMKRPVILLWVVFTSSGKTRCTFRQKLNFLILTEHEKNKILSRSAVDFGILAIHRCQNKVKFQPHPSPCKVEKTYSGWTLHFEK